MPHAENKVEWCLRKAERELKEGGTHRGLVRTKPDQALARRHIEKAEHNLKAMSDFKAIGYSDWSASAAFYSVYHSLLAVLARNGFESRNQECTYALILTLIEEGKLSLDKVAVQSLLRVDPETAHESPSIVGVRESKQYGVSMSLEDDTYTTLKETAMEILEGAKYALEG